MRLLAKWRDLLKSVANDATCGKGFCLNHDLPDYKIFMIFERKSFSLNWDFWDWEGFLGLWLEVHPPPRSPSPNWKSWKSCNQAIRQSGKSWFRQNDSLPKILPNPKNLSSDKRRMTPSRKSWKSCNQANHGSDKKSQFRRSPNFLSKGKETREFLFSNRVLQHNCHPPANGVDEVDGFRFFEVGSH